MKMNLKKIFKKLQSSSVPGSNDVNVTLTDGDISSMGFTLHGTDMNLCILNYTQEYGKCEFRIWVDNNPENIASICKIMNDVLGIYTKIYVVVDNTMEQTVYAYFLMDGVGKWVKFHPEGWSGVYGAFDSKRYYRNNLTFVTVDEHSEPELLRKIQNDPPNGWEVLKVEW